MTGLGIIKSAMRKVNALATGEEPSAEESADALEILNDMVDTWNAERLSIFTIDRNEYSLVVGQQVYTYGAGGDFSAARPARIERAGILSLNNPVQPLELPLEILDYDGWAGIPVKNLGSALPSKLYDDGAFPLRNLSFWPFPNASIVKVAFYVWEALTSFDLGTDHTFPPGYARAIRYGLALDLAPEFGVPVPAAVAALAISSKAVISSMNLPAPVMRCDPAVVGTRGVYDWRTDGYGPGRT